MESTDISKNRLAAKIIGPWEPEEVGKSLCNIALLIERELREYSTTQVSERCLLVGARDALCNIIGEAKNLESPRLFLDAICLVAHRTGEPEWLAENKAHIPDWACFALGARSQCANLIELYWPAASANKKKPADQIAA